MAWGARANVGQNGEEDENREECPAVGRPPEKAGERGCGGGDKDREEQGVVEPAERLRVHDAELNEQTEGKVQDEQDRGGVEDQGYETHCAD